MGDDSLAEDALQPLFTSTNQGWPFCVSVGRYDQCSFFDHVRKRKIIETLHRTWDKYSVIVFRYGLVILCFLSYAVVRAEDWTVKGKEYHNVVVGKVEVDRVHITYDGGVGSVALSDLPSDLQKRFHYDPDAAVVAAQAREKRDAEIDAKLNAEMAAKAKADENAQHDELLHGQIAREGQTLVGSVIQKVDGGYLVNCVGIQRAVVSSTGAVGLGGYGPSPDANTGEPPMLGGGDYFLILSKDMVDGDVVNMKVYPAGEYSYEDVRGVERTVRCYSDSLDTAVARAK